ncbi:MAG: hypothetical protein WCB51_09255, partial [Candidatus Dormiibacterota bacterium]
VLPIRVPILRLQTDSAPVAGARDLTVAGKLITVQGDVLGPASAAPTPSSGVVGPFGTLQVLSDSDRAAALSRVSSIQVVANATAFQEVELEVAVGDATGGSVDGLDAGSFTVKEQGTPVDGFALYSNVRVQQRPRVLIVYDGFVTFAPNLFTSDASKAAFESSLAAAITAQSAKTPFDVQVIPIGATPDAGAWAPPDVTRITAALAAAHESADDPWGTVGGPALDEGVTAIILVSDMNSLDTDPVRLPTYQRRLMASRVPVFTVPVGQIDQAVNSQIVTIGGGASLDAADPATPAKVAALVAPAVSAWVGGGYRIRYQAHADGPPRRTVTINLASHDNPVGTATYQVPTEPVPPPSFAGLYVTIAFGRLSATRRIAGVEIRPGGAPLGALDDPAVVAETRAALDGVTTIAVEPGTPTTAALLDDVLSSMLTVAPLVPIAATATNAQIVTAVKGGVRRTPLLLPALLRPTTVDQACAPGLRVAIMQDRALTSALLEEHADLAVGLNEVVPLTTDRHTAFKAAVATSVAACAAEAATYPNSAFSLLSGRTLTPVAAGDYGAINAWLNTVPANRQAAWNAIVRVYDGYHLLLPAAGGVDALWVVDPNTGVAKAVLLDSTGGGVITMACKYDAFDQLAIAIAMLSIMCSFGGSVAFPFFCVGINAAAGAMAAAALFVSPSHADAGTPYGLAMFAASPYLDAFPNFSGGVGIILLLITLQAGCGK